MFLELISTTISGETPVTDSEHLEPPSILACLALISPCLPETLDYIEMIDIKSIEDLSKNPNYRQYRRGRFFLRIGASGRPEQSYGF